MFAGILLTPRTIIDELADKIIRDLINQTSIKILWKKYWRLNTKEIDIIYPKLERRPFQDNLIRNLTMGDSLILLASGSDIYNKLTRAKGEFKTIHPDGPKVTGIRLKYWRREMTVNKIFSHPANDLFFEYRVHTTDSIKETSDLIAICANKGDLKQIEKVAPEF